MTWFVFGSESAYTLDLTEKTTNNALTRTWWSNWVVMTWLYDVMADEVSEVDEDTDVVATAMLAVDD